MLLSLILCCVGGPAVAQDDSAVLAALPRSLLFAWLKDNNGDHPAFLAVIDADRDSANYGSLLTTVSSLVPGEDAHHTPHRLPASGRIFANAFRDGRTFIYDTANPLAPTLAGEFSTIGEYHFPHSFAELPGGNFLVTFQTRGEDNGQAGGLVELTPEGELVRAAAADDPAAVEFIRPYSLEVLPQLDRVVSTSADMWRTQATEHIQLWRLSDLSLLSTTALPPGERRNLHQIPLEARSVGDGDSVYVVTWNCGLYHVTGLDGPAPQARLVWDFNARACAVPLRIGNYWVQAVGDVWQVVVLQISDPAVPLLTSVLQLPDQFQPHWIAAEPGADRIVMSGYEALSDRIVMLEFDRETGALSVDERFGRADETLPGFFTDREIWPHGKTGPATAHGIVFWPAAAGAQ